MYIFLYYHKLKAVYVYLAFTRPHMVTSDIKNNNKNLPSSSINLTIKRTVIAIRYQIHLYFLLLSETK